MSRVVKGVTLAVNPNRFNREVEDLKGRQFGELRAVEFDHKDSYGRAVWQCRCSCGKDCLVPARHLKSGSVISCGHVNRAKAAKRMSKLNYKHGASNEPWFDNYAGMLARVHHPTGPDAKYYNSDWIDGPLIDPAWENDPWLFFKEIGEKPGKEYTVDRIDTHRGYVLGNVRWATKHQQSANRDFRYHDGRIQGIWVARKGTNRRVRDRYTAVITINRKHITLGTYLDLDNAKRARYDAETKYGFAHTFERPDGPITKENDPAKSDHPHISWSKKLKSWLVEYPIGGGNAPSSTTKYVGSYKTLDEAKAAYQQAGVDFKNDPEAFLNQHKQRRDGIVGIDEKGVRHYYKSIADFHRQTNSNANIYRRLKDGKPFTRKRSKFFGWRFEYPKDSDIPKN